MSLHRIDVNCFILEIFHTKTPSVKVSDNCGFRYIFHTFYLCTHNLLRALIISFLAWGRYSQFHSSDLYLDWAFAKITRIQELCQGKFFTCALIKLPTTKAYGNHFRLSLVPGTLTFPKLLPLTIGTGVGLLICILHFFRTFSEYAFAVTIIPLSFISMSLNS